MHSDHPRHFVTKGKGAEIPTHCGIFSAHSANHTGLKKNNKK